MAPVVGQQSQKHDPCHPEAKYAPQKNVISTRKKPILHAETGRELPYFVA